MAHREWTRPCDLCGHPITNRSKGQLHHPTCPTCGRSCNIEAQREQHGQPPRETPPDDPLNELAAAVHEHLLRKKTATRLDLADLFDVAPKRIDEALAVLKRSGYNVAIHDTEGEPPRIFLDSQAINAKHLHINAEKHFDGYRFDFGAVSDTHLGSKFYREEVLEAIYDEFAQNGIKHVFHGGNYIEGEARFNRFHLLAHGMSGQVDYFVKKYPRREGMTTYFVAGDDHEGWYQQREGIDIGEYTQQRAEAAGRKDLINLGYMEADVAIRAGRDKKCTIRVMHGGGGSAYAISYTAQKLVESFDGGTKPQILLLGHYHKMEWLFYRNVHVLQLGTTKAQDVFMRKLRLAAHVGGWRCSALIGKDGTVIRLTATMIPFFDRGYYESLTIDAVDDHVERGTPNETYNIVR